MTDSEKIARLADCINEISTLAKCLISSKALGERRAGCEEVEQMIDRKIKLYGVEDILRARVGLDPKNTEGK